MITRSALIYLSRQEGLKDFATRFRPFKKLTTRFVAGETIDETIHFIRELNAEGCSASFDHLNESVGSIAKPALCAVASTGTATKERREVWFERTGFVACPVYDRLRLEPNECVAGPAVLEEPDSTVLVRPDWRARLAEHGIIVMECV